MKHSKNNLPAILRPWNITMIPILIIMLGILYQLRVMNIKEQENNLQQSFMKRSLAKIQTKMTVQNMDVEKSNRLKSFALELVKGKKINNTVSYKARFQFIWGIAIVGIIISASVAAALVQKQGPLVFIPLVVFVVLLILNTVMYFLMRENKRTSKDPESKKEGTMQPVEDDEPNEEASVELYDVESITEKDPESKEDPKFKKEKDELNEEASVELYDVESIEDLSKTDSNIDQSTTADFVDDTDIELAQETCTTDKLKKATPENFIHNLRLAVKCPQLFKSSEMYEEYLGLNEMQNWLQLILQHNFFTEHSYPRTTNPTLLNTFINMTTTAGVNLRSCFNEIKKMKLLYGKLPNDDNVVKMQSFSERILRFVKKALRLPELPQTP